MATLKGVFTPPATLTRIEPKVVKHGGLDSFIYALADCREVAGDLLTCDDPRSLTIGFVHHPEEGDSVVHEIRLSSVKATIVSDEVSARVGLTPDEIREHLRSYEGRELLVTGKPPVPDTTPEQDAELAVAMMADLVEVRIKDGVAELLIVDQVQGDEVVVSTTPQTFARLPRSRTPAIRGWSRVDYPEDRDRIPMVTPRGEVYNVQFSGLYKRLSDSVLIIPDGGEGFKAIMSAWSMTDEDLTKIGGYVIPDGVDVSDTGVDPSVQASLLLTPQ